VSLLSFGECCTETGFIVDVSDDEHVERRSLGNYFPKGKRDCLLFSRPFSDDDEDVLSHKFTASINELRKKIFAECKPLKSPDALHSINGKCEHYSSISTN
jgi:hypothetical protein